MQLYYFLDYLNLRIVHYREEYFYSCATIYHKGIDVSKMLSHKMGNPCSFLLIAVTATLTKNQSFCLPANLTTKNNNSTTSRLRRFRLMAV